MLNWLSLYGRLNRSHIIIALTFFKDNLDPAQVVSPVFVEFEANVLLFVHGEVVSVVSVIVAYLGYEVSAPAFRVVAKPVSDIIQEDFST